MVESPASSAPTLPDIVQRVGAPDVTLALYNGDVSEQARETIRSYFDGQSVSLRHAATDDGRPRNFFVLHEGDEFVDATSLEDLYTAIRPESALLDVTDPSQIDYPDLLRKIDQSVFTDFGRPRMTVASREIEEYAYRTGGTLHAGFQRLSKLKPQYRLYERIADAGVETHLYGVPDWDVPSQRHVLHESGDDEIRNYWFVVLDGPNPDKRALLAEEAGPGRFYGFWTFDSEIVDTILDTLSRFPATRDSGL